MRDDPAPPEGPTAPAGKTGRVPDWMLELNPKERALYQRLQRRAKLTQAAVGFWLFASPLVIVPLIFRWHPLWLAAIVVGIAGAIIGFLLPTNVMPPPRHPQWDSDTPYGVYDPRGPLGPRS